MNNFGPEIYIASNLQTGQQYVGQTINFSRRISAHRSHAASETYFTRAIRAHGTNAFSFIHIPCSKEFLNEREQFFINKLGTMYPNGYNLTSGGEAGFIISELTRQKIGKTLAGRPIPKETRQKISIANLGRKRSAETRKKMKLSHSGKPLSIEHRNSISMVTKGDRNPFFGKHHSIETRQKISLSQLGGPGRHFKPHSLETCQKISKSLIGKVPSAITKEKMRQSQRMRRSRELGERNVSI